MGSELRRLRFRDFAVSGLESRVLCRGFYIGWDFRSGRQ